MEIIASLESGVLELWSIGLLENGYSDSSTLLQYSNTPALQNLFRSKAAILPPFGGYHYIIQLT